MTIEGKTWVFGNYVDTDVLAPGAYMKKPLAELASHCLEAVDPDFAKQVKHGDIIIAGEGFGIGSSREQAAQALVELGVSLVIADSFARIFYRNALNLGLPVLECPNIQANQQDLFSVDLVTGLISNQTQKKQWQCQPIPERLMDIVNAGGLMPYLKNKFSTPS